MKRSNRLVILVGVLLAVLAFVAIVIMLNRPDGGGSGAEEEPVTQTVLVATEDIDIGEEVTPEKAEPREVDPEAALGTPLTSTTQLQGQPARFRIPAGAQVSGEAVGIGGSDVIVDLPVLLNPGEKAIAFQVDRVTGLDFLVKPGDTIDIVMSQLITPLQETADSAANTDDTAPRRFEAITGFEDQPTVKAVLQDKRVLYVSATRAVQPEPEDTNNDGVINEEDEQAQQAAIDTVIIVFAGTEQDAEVIKYAQNQLGDAGALSAIVRHADDDTVEETIGITLDQLVEVYGLRIPGIVEQLQEETPTP